MSSLSVQDIIELFGRTDLHELGRRALDEKRRRYGDQVFWVHNVHVNYTNVCRGRCTFCRYRRQPDDPDAVTLTADQVLEQVAAAVERGAREAHLVGGLNEDLSLDYYFDLVARARRAFPELYLRAYTAVEIDFLARRFRLDPTHLLSRFRDAGLDALAGGGAEIFAPRVRTALCPEKIDADRWLDIHRAAHRLGLRSNATMLFGHVETATERADHLLRLRHLQDETGGFASFLPFPVVGFDTNDSPTDPQSPPEGGGPPWMVGGIDALRTVAVSRIALDNIPHLKVFWPIWSVKLAQLALSYGADDFDGTVGTYRIVDSEHCAVSDGLAPQQIESLIRHAGLAPVERDGWYRPV